MPRTSLGWGHPTGAIRAIPATRGHHWPSHRHGDQADRFAHADLDVIGTPIIDPAALGQALAAADEELYQPGPWP
jgi:hypothetical protein